MDGAFYIVLDDVITQRVLSDSLARAGLGDCGFAVSAAQVPEGAAFMEVEIPLRLGEVLDRAGRFLRDGAGHAEPLAIGPHFTMEIHNPALRDARSGEIIRLTEKEHHILKLLCTAQGGVVGKRQLLDEVWAYHETAETHTLETHIYRLRQKIEADPSAPALLVTEEAGYRLAL